MDDIKNMIVGHFEPRSKIIYEGCSTTRLKTHFGSFMANILHIIYITSIQKVWIQFYVNRG